MRGDWLDARRSDAIKRQCGDWPDACTCVVTGYIGASTTQLNGMIDPRCPVHGRHATIILRHKK
jgi:hypothetical protein